MKIKQLFYLFSFLFSLSFISCSSEEPLSENTSENNSGTERIGENSPNNADSDNEFVLCKGADISWLTEMEAYGWKFYYDDGTQGDCIDILKNKGVNAIRLRVWVNPANQYCGTDDVIAKAIRSKDAGMDVMIDFHYSDSWADPSKQTVPAAWQGQTAEELIASIATYTTEVLTKLNEAGVTPKWVQVGNETGNGMLWPYGQADKNPKTYADMVTSGYNAVKAVFPQAKVIVHIQNGQDKNLFKWNLDILKKYNAQYDVVGMSLYPEPNNYASMVEQCKSNMQTIISTYNKDVMLCEVGMGNSYVTQCKDFLTLCFQLSEEINNDRYLGLLYWEPQCYNDWNGYKKGCFTNQGRPSAAMDAYSYGSSCVPEIRM